ncbi:phage portal protein [soil metagenome]
MTVIGRLRAFFQAPEAKRSAVAPLIALQGLGQPQWTPRNYAALAREGFAANAIGYRCVRMIAESAAAVPWLVYEGAKERDRHPLLDLLARPNPGVTGRDLLESFYGHLQVAGNAYLEAVRLDGQVRELHVLRPDRMKAVAGPNGWPEAYEYSVSGSSVRLAQGDAVLHLRLFNPLNDYYGMSPLEAAARGVDIHNAAGAWSKAVLDNAARPSGALMYKGIEGAPNLTAEQFARLKSELHASFQGAGNAGRPMVLEGGLDWKPMSFSPRDMDFIETRNAAAREIALAFGVPPMLLGIPGDNTYANYAEANRSLWRQTVLPLVGRTADALTQFLGPSFGSELRLGYDADQIEALSTEREALWSRVGAASFISDDEKRAAVGYGTQVAES